ncbi:MAG: SufE family protein [Maricaulaceae bacterium]
MPHPQHIQDMIDDFSFMDDWEDRYMHVIDLGRDLAPLGDDERNDATRVTGCASQVWLTRDPDPNNQGRLFYRGDSDAHIVKGLVAIMIHIFSGQTPNDIIKTDIKAIMSELGLAEHLSQQRSNGLKSMVERIRHDANAA